ncbi:MAG: hypothetical protein ACETV1_07305, partial [Candidatus Bathyarchaeia archaeon]
LYSSLFKAAWISGATHTLLETHPNIPHILPSHHSVIDQEPLLNRITLKAFFPLGAAYIWVMN